MSLVNSNRSNARKIDRGRDIVPDHEFSLKEDKKVASVTFGTTVRIDNHIKNKLEALATIGLSASQRESLETALAYYLDSLPAEQKRKFQVQLATLEERDVLLKTRNK